MIIRRLGPLSLAKMMGALYFVMGFIFGLLITCLSLIVPAFSHSSSGGGRSIFGGLFGVFAVIALPLFYGAMGFIMGLISAALYNLLARFLGGIDIEFEPAPSSPPSEATPIIEESV